MTNQTCACSCDTRCKATISLPDLGHDIVYDVIVTYRALLPLWLVEGVGHWRPQGARWRRRCGAAAACRKRPVAPVSRLRLWCRCRPPCSRCRRLLLPLPQRWRRRWPRLHANMSMFRLQVNCKQRKPCDVGREGTMSFASHLRLEPANRIKGWRACHGHGTRTRRRPRPEPSDFRSAPLL